MKPEIDKWETDDGREAGKGVKCRSQAPSVSVCARLSQRGRQIRLSHSSGRGFAAGGSRLGPCVLSVSLCYPWTFEAAQVRETPVRLLNGASARGDWRLKPARAVSLSAPTQPAKIWKVSHKRKDGEGMK